MPRGPPEDVEMSEIKLPSTHRIQNSNPGGLRSRTLPLGHGGPPQSFHEWMSKKHLCFFQTAETGKRANCEVALR